MKQAASFRARPQVFERLLFERAGIGEDELEKLRNQHARAGSYLRSITARAAHRARQHANRQDAPREEPGIAEAVASRDRRPCRRARSRRVLAAPYLRSGRVRPGARRPARLANALQGAATRLERPRPRVPRSPICLCR